MDGVGINVSLAKPPTKKKKEQKLMRQVSHFTSREKRSEGTPGYTQRTRGMGAVIVVDGVVCRFPDLIALRYNEADFKMRPRVNVRGYVRRSVR